MWRHYKQRPCHAKALILNYLRAHPRNICDNHAQGGTDCAVFSQSAVVARTAIAERK
jgi:hypothetical protein